MKNGMERYVTDYSYDNSVICKALPIGDVSKLKNMFKTSYGNVEHDNLVDLWNSNWLKEFRLKQLELPRSEIPYCNICDCESDDDIDDVADIMASRIRENG